MYILTEHEVNRDISRLDRAWSEQETFSFVSDSGSVSTKWINNAVEELPPELRERHFALLTSGSTGQPKLIIGSRERAENLANVLWVLQESPPVEQVIVLLPLTYSYAFVNQWLCARCHERRLVLTPGFGSPDIVKDALKSARDAMICLVGAHVPLLERYFVDESFPGVLRVHFAGGRFPQERLDTLHKFFPNARIFNNFGCAEAMPRLTLRKAEDADSASDVGKPLPGVELKSDEASRLLFRSPYGAVGFIDDGGFSAIAPETWVPTGDQGIPTDQGSWCLTGRDSEVFKRYGEKISLALLLATVYKHWHGQAAFYRETDDADEDGHVLILSPSPSSDQLRGILKAFRIDFSRVHWPLRVESIDSMPLLPNGKIDQMALANIHDKTTNWYQRI